MKILRILLSVLVGLIVPVALVGMLLPSEQHVERSIVVKADPAVVFALVNDFRAFNKWSPWAEYDPEGTRYEFSGPPAGVGSRMSWSSDHPNVGSGVQEIVESRPGSFVRSRLAFDGFESASYATFILEPANGGTRVTWGFDAELDGIIGRYMGLMMDKWVGADYEQGLARLRQLAEG